MGSSGFVPENPPPAEFPTFLSMVVPQGSMGVASAAIGWFWKLKGTVVQPQSAFLTSLVCKGGERSKVPARRMKPLLIDDVKRVLSRLEQKASLADLRLRAMIGFVFFGALRVGEALNLKLCDVEFVSNGVKLRIWWAKSDR